MLARARWRGPICWDRRAIGYLLTSVTESGVAVGERTLEYLYLGQGGSWNEWSGNGEGYESSHEWETMRLVEQQSTSR